MSRLWCCLAVVLLVVLTGCTSPRSVGRAAAPSVDHAAAPAGLAAVPEAEGSAAPASLRAATRAGHSRWRLVYSTDFPVAAPLGSFSGCKKATYTCTGLPQVLQSQWWAYEGGPDTATERHLKVGGYWSPSTTVWISGGVMNIRLWRGTGSVHSAAVLPKAALGRRYGKYVETFRVADPVIGYKSAHLLWAMTTPTDHSSYQIDYPEANWGTQMVGFVHYRWTSNRPRFPAGAAFNRQWHTTVIEWTPQGLKLFCDGRLVGSLAGNVSDVPMRWVLQNETQANGAAYPATNSSSTMQIKYVAYYKWTG